MLSDHHGHPVYLLLTIMLNLAHCHKKMGMHIEARHCGSSQRRCQYCGGIYKNLNSLRVHWYKMHKEERGGERRVMQDDGKMDTVWG